MFRNLIANELLLAAKDILSANNFTATNAEKEVERLFRVVLSQSPYKGKAFAVGGYVRDEVLGLEAKDLDVVVDMRDGARKLTKWIRNKFPQEVTNPYQLGSGYPIWQITFKEDIEYNQKLYKTKGAVIEFADAQKEAFPDADSRQRVTQPGTLKDDIERRDFSVNMLLKDLSSGELKDLTGVSINDIKQGILRGHPGVNFEKIIRDDPLRMMRLVRFQAKYGWQVPKSVLRAVKNNSSRISIISSERIRDELVKLMQIGKLRQGIRIMKVLGLLKHVFPEIDALRGIEHDTVRGKHLEGDVYRHTLLVLKNAKPGVENQLAALLHDVGKPKTQEILSDKIQFLGHEVVSGEITEAIMRRLKFDSKTTHKVKVMVENHMRPHSLGNSTPKALRKFIREVGDEMVDSILDLAEADQLGTLPPDNMIPDLREKLNKVTEIPIPSKPILDGKELMGILGLRPGPDVGRAMKFLIEKEDEYASTGIELTKQKAIDLLKREFL